MMRTISAREASGTAEPCSVPLAGTPGPEGQEDWSQLPPSSQGSAQHVWIHTVTTAFWTPCSARETWTVSLEAAPGPQGPSPRDHSKAKRLLTTHRPRGGQSVTPCPVGSAPTLPGAEFGWQLLKQVSRSLCHPPTVVQPTSAC